MHRAPVSSIALLLLLAACSEASSDREAVPSSASSTSTTSTTVRPPPPLPFEGLGAWVDAFDYAPAYQSDGAPSVTPAAVDEMADAGVRTLYLQVAKDDPRSAGDLVHEELAGQFLVRAHARGMDVVAWFLPLHVDTAADLRRFRAMVDLDAEGEHFDGYALDVEWVDGVADHDTRSAELLELTAGARAAVGEAPLAAIVYSPVALEVVNPDVWPGFPWTELARFYDAWMPMTYWTFREGSSYRDPAVYVTESVERLRANVEDQEAAVHPIGGIGDASTTDDYAAFLAASESVAAVGWSVYDWATTSLEARSRLSSRAR